MPRIVKVTIAVFWLMIHGFSVNAQTSQISQAKSTRWTSHNKSITALVFSHNGKILASGGIDQAVKVWDVESGKLITTLKGHPGGIYLLSFSSDDKILASASGKEIKLWELETGKLVKTFANLPDVSHLSFNSNGRMLGASVSKFINVWDVESGRLLSTMSGHAKEIEWFYFDSDGKTVVSFGLDNTIRYWEITSGKLLSTLMRPIAGARMMFSADRKKLATWNPNDWNEITFWEIAAGKVLSTLRINRSTYPLALSPNGKTIAVKEDGRSIQLIDAISGKQTAILAGQIVVHQVAFSPNGKIIVSASDDKIIRVWIAESGTLSSSLVDSTNSPPKFPSVVKTKTETKYEYNSVGGLTGALTTIYLETLAVDLDDDEISYTWSVDATVDSTKDFKSDYMMAKWRRKIVNGKPSPGRIIIVASDGKGEADSHVMTLENR